MTVRAGGQADVAAGAEVALRWLPEAEHYFDAQGRRVP
jgi:hypothetical protein